MNKKKIFAVLMSVMMMVTFMPTMAFAGVAGDPSATPNYQHGTYYVDGVTDNEWKTVKGTKQFTYDGEAHKVWLYATKYDKTDVSVSVTYNFWKYDTETKAFVKTMKDSEEAPVVKDTGLYKIQATATWAKRSGNEDTYKYDAFTFNVAPKKATVKAKTTTLTKAYDGKGFQFNDSMFIVDGLVTGDALFAATELTDADVNEYYVYANKVDTNTNYSVRYDGIFTDGKCKVSITPAVNTVTISTASKSFKANAVKKAKKSFAISATATFGTPTIVKYSGSKKLSVKDGAIVVKKGTKKGTYKITVVASVPASKNVALGFATKTITVKVK